VNFCPSSRPLSSSGSDRTLLSKKLSNFDHNITTSNLHSRLTITTATCIEPASKIANHSTRLHSKLQAPAGRCGCGAKESLVPSINPCARKCSRASERTTTPPRRPVPERSSTSKFAFPPTAVHHLGGIHCWRYSVASAPVASAMASGFIGISVIVTLQNPPNTLVHGVVAAVNPQNATLTLQDGTSHIES
jgi:hypothetical protein